MSPVHPKPLTVLVVDESEFVRARICGLLGESPKLRVVASVGDGVHALLAATRFRPDAAVVDLHLRRMSGLELLRRLKSSMPECAVVVLTSFPPEPFRGIIRALGADEILHKATEFEGVATYLNSLLPASPKPKRLDEPYEFPKRENHS